MGLCVHHTPPKCTLFDSNNSLEYLATRLDNKHSHIGVEHNVISACALGQPPQHAIPVVAFVSCRYFNPQQQRMVFETVSEPFLVEFHRHVAFMCPARHVDETLNTSLPNLSSANGSRQHDVPFSMVYCYCLFICLACPRRYLAYRTIDSMTPSTPAYLWLRMGMARGAGCCTASPAW